MTIKIKQHRNPCTFDNVNTIKIKKHRHSCTFDNVNQKYQEALDMAVNNPGMIVEPNESFHGGTLPVGQIQKLFDIFWKSTSKMREVAGIETGSACEQAHKILFVDALNNPKETKDTIENLCRTSQRNMFVSFLGGYGLGGSLVKCRLPRSETKDNKNNFSEELVHRVQDNFTKENGWKYSADEIAEIMTAIENTVNQMWEEANA